MQNIYANSEFIGSAKNLIQEQFDKFAKLESDLQSALNSSKDAKFTEPLSQAQKVAQELKNTAKSMIGYLNGFMQSGKFPSKTQMLQSIADIASTGTDDLDRLREFSELGEGDKLGFRFVCVNLEQASKFLDTALEILDTALKSVAKMR